MTGHTACGSWVLHVIGSARVQRAPNKAQADAQSETRAAQVESCWEHHCNQMLTIRQIFLYLDRSYVINTSGVRSLYEMGLQLFRNHLAQHPEVCSPGTQIPHQKGLLHAASAEASDASTAVAC